MTRVDVEAGETVKKGQTLVILIAAKMGVGRESCKNQSLHFCATNHKPIRTSLEFQLGICKCPFLFFSPNL